jgi:cobaltochelatase CobN
MLAAATSKRDGAIVSIPEQVDAVAGKAVARAVQSTPNAGKRVAILFYNYPSGEESVCIVS